MLTHNYIDFLMTYQTSIPIDDDDSTTHLQSYGTSLSTSPTHSPLTFSAPQNPALSSVSTHLLRFIALLSAEEGGFLSYLPLLLPIFHIPPSPFLEFFSELCELLCSSLV